MNLTGNIYLRSANFVSLGAIQQDEIAIGVFLLIGSIYAFMVFTDRKDKAKMTPAQRYRARASVMGFLSFSLPLTCILWFALKFGVVKVEGVPFLMAVSTPALICLFIVAVIEMLRMEIELKPQWRLFCPHCGKFTAYEEKWHCGYCDHLNEKVSVYESCAVCGNEPGAYKCNHCKKLILFSVVKPDEQHFARHYREPAKPATPATEPSIRQKRSDEEDEIKHKILVAKMNTELATVEKQFKSLSKEVEDLESSRSRSSSQREKIEHQLKQDMERGMAMLNLVEAERKRIRKEFENDEELMERHLAWLEQWYAENMDRTP